MGRSSIAGAILLLAGCDQVFGLDGERMSRRDDAAIDAAPEQCPTSYSMVPFAPQTSRYRFVTAPALNWDYAEQTCEADTRTPITHLAVFENSTEMDALDDAFAGPQQQPYIWVGFARDTTGDVRNGFRAITGAPLPDGDPRWEPLEPTGLPHGATEETAVWFGWGRDLTDGPWDQQYAYLCECDGMKPGTVQTH